MIKKCNKKEIKKVKSMIEKAKNVKQIGQYGLVGNSGLGIGGFLHISMPYDCNGKVLLNIHISINFLMGILKNLILGKELIKVKLQKKILLNVLFVKNLLLD